MPVYFLSDHRGGTRRPPADRALDASRLEALSRLLHDAAEQHSHRLDAVRAPRPQDDPALVAALAADARELAEIRAALDRMAAGTYGRCTCCGGPIALPSLEARPQARGCVACLTAYAAGA